MPLPAVVGAGVAEAATAPATGDAGVFTPVQARLVDSRDGTGLARSGALTAGTWTPFGVLGRGGIPSSGVSAVALTVTVVGAQDNGGMQLAPATNTAGAQGEVLQYLVGQTISNTAMVAVGTDGQVSVKTRTAEQVIVEVQGYYSSGAAVAPGGFVPLTNTRYVDTRQSPGITTSPLVGRLSPGTIYHLRMRDVAGIPGTANAVYANLTALANGPANTLGSLTIWPEGDPQPAAQTSFPGNNITGLGRTVDSNSAGDVSIQLSGNAGPIDLIIDIQGYFDAQPSTNGFTPAASRIYDSNTATLAPNTETAIQVTGVNGLPAAAANLAAFALNLTVVNSNSGSGNIVAYPADTAAPVVTDLNYQPSQTYPSALTLVRTSTSTGQIKVLNRGNVAIRLIVDVQGYYTNAGLLGFPYGNNGVAAGDRSAASMVTRQLTDQTRLAWNPTTGNALFNGNLLNLAGVNGNGVNVSWRYNSINDLRPTLSVGTYESALQVQGDGSVRYVNPTGGIDTFTPVSGGGYLMPPGLNATLTRVSTTRFEMQMNTGASTNIYDANGSTFTLSQVLDTTRTNVVTYTYANGNLSRITDTQGRVVTFTYADSRNLVQPSTITDTTLNRSIALVYGGPGGALTQITDLTGKVTALGYNTANQLSQVTDARNQVTQVTYDSGTRVTQLAYAVGSAAAQTFTAAYPANGSTTMTNPLGKTTTYTYSGVTGLGTLRVTMTTDPNGNTAQGSFDNHDNKLTATNGAGQKSTSAFDATKNVLTKATSPQSGTATGASQIYTYVSTTVASGASPFSDYRPSSSTDDQGNLTNYGYDTVSANISAIYTAGGARGTLIRRYQGDNANTACSAKTGQLCSETNGENQTTSYGYDTTGNLTRITPPAPLGATTMTYDAAGRVATMTDGNNQTARYTYDGLDRHTQVTYGAAGTCTAGTCTTYTYDPVGNLTTRADASGTTTWAFDAQNRNTAKTTGPTTTSVTFDATGNLASYTDPAGTVTYGYDPANRVISLAEPGGSCPTTKPGFPNTTGCTWFDYDQANRRTYTTFPNGSYNQTHTDPSGKIDFVLGQATGATNPVVKRTYAYNPGPGGADGTIRSSVTDEAGVASTYGYDAFRQLKSVTTAGTTEAFTYDKNGNRTQDTKTGAPTTYAAYNPADQLCRTNTTAADVCTNPAPSGSTSYSYDGNGNTTGAGTSTYANNVYNQVTTATTGGTATGFGYADTTNTERTSAGDTTFLNGLLGITQKTTAGTTTSYIRDPSGALIGIRLNGVTSYYTTDALGSVIYISPGGSGNPTRYTYDANGNTTTATGDLATTNPYRYAGGYYDTQTGLTKMGARYYDPTQGRFTQRDPSGKSQHYLYGDNNPISNTDTTGLSVDSIGFSGCVVAFCVAVYFNQDDQGHQGFTFQGGAGAGAGGAFSYTKYSGEYSSGAYAYANCVAGPFTGGGTASSGGLSGGVGVTTGTEASCSLGGGGGFTL